MPVAESSGLSSFRQESDLAKLMDQARLLDEKFNIKPTPKHVAAPGSDSADLPPLPLWKVFQLGIAAVATRRCRVGVRLQDGTIRLYESVSFRLSTLIQSTHRILTATTCTD